MEVTQIYGVINTVTSEILGDTAVVNEDLSNIVDIGEAVFNANAVDAYTKSLVNQIGKMIFVNRVYRGSAPSVLMDGWEFGSVLCKVQGDLPEATENETWELNDGASYDPNIFHKPSVSVKFYNKRVTFEIDVSFTERQIKQSFTSVEQLNAFLSMLYNDVDKSLTVKIDALIMRTINAVIGETIHAEYPAAAYTASSGVRAVNLLYLYNQKFGTAITKAEALTTPEFIRFAILTMGLYIDRIKSMSTLFNVGGKARFTPADMLHVILLSDFENSAKVYLQSDTFNKELVALPNAETVPYWQGSGTGYDFGSVSKIDVKTPSNDTVTIDGIIGVIFDRDTLGVANLDRRVTTNYNAKGEFFNNFYKFDAGYFCDMNENAVVFFVQ